MVCDRRGRRLRRRDRAHGRKRRPGPHPRDRQGRARLDRRRRRRERRVLLRSLARDRGRRPRPRRPDRVLRLPPARGRLARARADPRRIRPHPRDDLSPASDRDGLRARPRLPRCCRCAHLRHAGLARPGSELHRGRGALGSRRADVRPGDPEDGPDPPVDRLAGRRRLGLRGDRRCAQPALGAIEGLTFIGFVGFFVWMAAMGVSLLRGHPPEAPAAPVVPA